MKGRVPEHKILLIGKVTLKFKPKRVRIKRNERPSGSVKRIKKFEKSIISLDTHFFIKTNYIRTQGFGDSKGKNILRIDLGFMKMREKENQRYFNFFQ